MSNANYQRAKGFCDLVRFYQEHRTFPQDWDSNYLREGLGPNGCIALLAAGNLDTGDYEKFLQAFSWYDFYTGDRGDRFMVSLAHGLAYLGYEYLFIDARTGLTDVAFISTIHLPDLVVLMTNLTRQSIDGIRRRIGFIEECNAACAEDGCKQRKPGYAHRPIGTIVAASPLPRGEWNLRQERIARAQESFERSIDIEIDYQDLLAVGEEDQILFRRMNERDLDANAFLAGATRPYQRLADEIARRNPESPENLIEDGKRLWEMGLWRVAKAHFDEAGARIADHALRFYLSPADPAVNPTYQEAKIGWLFADLDALDPEKDQQEIEEHEKHSSATKQIAIEQARLWLALAFRYILLNKFAESAKAADEAQRRFAQLSSGYPTDYRLKDLRALALLRSGYAWMLSNRWTEAAERTRQACDTYRRLAARPLLLSLSLCQLARIDLMIGDVEAMRRVQASLELARKFVKETATDLPPPTASPEIRSQHVQADFHHARALVLYEQGCGIKAREAFDKSFELYREDEDAVGKSDLLVLLWSLGLRDPVQDKEDRPHPITRAIDLRIPAGALRLALARWSLFIAMHSLDAAAVDDIEAELCPLLGPLDQWWNGSMAAWDAPSPAPRLDAMDPEAWRFDPALPALVLLERVRFLLSRSSNEDLTRAAAILESVRDYRERLKHGPDPTPDIDPELAHPSRLLQALLEVAQPTDAQARQSLVADLLDQAELHKASGYRLREAQLRLVLALMDPKTQSAPLKSLLDDRIIDAPGQWPWSLPVAFVFHSGNEPLQEAWKALGDLSDRIWRGPGQDAS